MKIPSPQKKTASQKAYADKSRKKDEFQRKVNEAAEARAKKLKESNPDYADLDIKCMNVAYVRGQKGISKVYFKIADMIMYPENMGKTQAAIIKEIQPLFPELTIRTNIWNRELIPAVKDRIERRMSSNTSKPINFRGCNTLAQMRKRVKAAFKVAGSGKTFKTPITFASDSVVIGKTSYPITKKSAAGKVYPSIRVEVIGKGRCWVRVDALKAVLQSG